MEAPSCGYELKKRALLEIDELVNQSSDQPELEYLRLHGAFQI